MTCRCGREKHIPLAEFCGVCKIGIKRLYKEMQAKFWHQAVEVYFSKAKPAALPGALNAAGFQEEEGSE